MKEFKKSNTVTYNLMSFTGFKSLMVFMLLLDSPKTYHEICDYFKNHEYIKEEISIDTFRVYITSLKRCGCEIERTKSKDGARYAIVSHPFEFKLSSEQIRSLIKVYKIVAQTIDLCGLYALDCFLQDFAEKINCEELKLSLAKVSVFSRIEPQIIKRLFECAENHYQVAFVYNSPRRKNIECEIVVDKLDISSGKLYVYGTNVNYKEYSYFQVQRVVKILTVKTDTVDVLDLPNLIVKYELKNLPVGLKLSDEEKIIDIKEEKVIIEMKSKNKFALKQKILSYGALCKVIEPLDFKEEIIATLKQMREEYSNGEN